MNNKSKKIGLIVLTAIIVFLTNRVALAQQGPMITFRLDDGLTSQYNYARPILNKYNFPAVAYIFTDPPEEGDWIGYMSWSQIEELQNVYGWEIGSHSKSHPDLTQLPDPQLIAELSESKAILESHGLVVESFASPFGLYDDRVLSYITQFYKSHGSAWPYGFNSYPFNNYEILVQEVRGSTSLGAIEGWIDEAVLNKKWLILLFHEIVESNPGEYEYSKDNFEAIVDYVNTKNVPVITVKEALDIPIPIPTKNLIPNPSFESTTGGWADNWIRGDTSHIILDTNGNGASPNPTNSLKFASTSDTASVYTENFIDIDPNKTYPLKVYFNCQDFTSGGVDIFIDEYDSQGNWLNWVWQTGIWSKYVGYKEVTYSPSSNTDKILVWIEGVAGSNLTCYVDNIVLTDTSETDDTNSAPVLVINIPDQSFDEDTALTNAFDLDDYFSDPDGDYLTYSSSGATNVTVTINLDGTVDFSALTDWNGLEDITFVASDGSLTAQDTITVTVNPVNDAPVITSIPILTAIPNTDYIYDVEATDVDEDALTYSLITHPAGMIVNADTGLITWIPTTDQLGDHSLVAEVSDGLLSNIQSWTITVSETSPNLVSNPSFESATGGWAEQWIREDTSHIILDTNNNGGPPNPTNSLKFTGGADTYSVYTQDFIDVDPNKTYLFKVYFNCQNFTSGGVDVFIDEYDSNRNWLNWKWQTGIWTDYAGYKTTTYIPSNNTKKLLIWIEGVSGSNLTCYVDNVVLEEAP